MKYLFVAEKPSLMRDVLSCYNKHQDEIINKIGYIDFVALSGHVCTIYEPNDYDEWADKKWGDVDYPMIPNHWKIKTINDAGKRKTVSQIKQTVRSYDGVIVGTDSDVEGYGIYYLLENYLQITDMKALRFIEHSLTDKEILQSLYEMTDYHTDTLHQRFVKSFLLRSRADWLFGMNATRMLSVKLQETIATGRVKAPTIKLVYDNSIAIANFKPEKYWNIVMKYDGFGAFLTEDDKNPKSFKDKSEVPQNIPLDGVVKIKETNRVQTKAPQLYDLAAIQSEAGQSHGFSPEETLTIVQSLYETHKLLSYPRTQCRYVSYEKSKEFPIMLKNMSVFDGLKNIADKMTNDDLKRVMGDRNVINDDEVQKESHDALIPTTKKPDLNNLNDKEKIILEMVYRRLLAQFLPKVEEDKTNMVITHGNYDFVTKGNIVINHGWKILYRTSKDNVIPPINVGDSITANEFITEEKVTKPPRRLNQSTLLNAMINIASLIQDKELKKNLAQSKGIGTPATRASIINDIIERGYVDKKKDGLYITDIGIKYINSIKTLDIVSPVFAAQLETKIHKIQRGEINYEEVYSDMIESLNNMCHQIDGMPSVQNTIDVKCPCCNNEKLNVDRYEYICRKCGFKIARSICGVNIKPDIVEILVSGNETPFYTFKKKSGDTFRAKLKLIDNEVKMNFNSGLSCPNCGADNIKLNKGGAFCDCGLKIFRNLGDRMLSDDEITKLLAGKRLEGIWLKSKAGNPYSVDLFLNGTTVEREFSNK